ncbi:alpha/beta fold hydrolase [Salinisphaera sp. Q1T1-3]|uniref:alpha/beta hydrolase n=1 Tax=Salinisphaera sp. Q1T1-3 TaxID=2321229 RepID=UPI000E757A3E|nr:alpha/beta fold hydrolase [Salinisphaera sp. Q1T1-3]RJS94416.1 hypothetical protein D3260_04755 [Salinisphaera sp. Q1T1-3]
MRRALIIGAASLLVASLVGCSDEADVDDGGGRDTGGTPTPAAATSRYAPISETPRLPFPNDLLFVDAMNNSATLTGLAADGTLNVSEAAGNPLVAGLNRLDGFSTTDNLYLDFDGAAIDTASANDGGVRLIDLSNGQSLSAGTDFDVVRSSVSVDHPRLLIRPLKPLNPATTYGVVITRELTADNGGRVAPSDQFAVVASADAVGSDANPATRFSAEQRRQLALIRTTMVRPLLESADVSADEAVVAWRFTTQSVGDSLRALAAEPRVNPNAAADGGIRVRALPNAQGGRLSTGDINPALADTADLYQGTVDLAYYLPANDADNDDETPLTGFWHNDGTAAAGDATLRALDGSGVACRDIARPVSTTGCYPRPAMRSVQSVPVLVAVPNANSASGGQPPAGGWPVVIFQHGITANRTNVFAIAPALAAAGFVTVAIDLPLHGLPASNALAIDGAERTFSLDADGDGVVDASGANFINLRSPITSRDNTREAVVDLIDLAATLRQGRIPVAGGEPIGLDGRAPQFVGHSLGAIVGGTLAGVTDRQAIDGITLANPGGGVIRLLAGSAAFGPQITAGLRAAGIAQGSEASQDFLRIAQTLLDPADPINHAAAGAGNHPLHMIEVVGGGNGGTNPPDTVVPNAVPVNVGPDFSAPAPGACPASPGYTPALDTVCIGAPLSGTDPLAAAFGLVSRDVSLPYARDAVSAGRVIRFASGAHSTFLDPMAGTASGQVNPQAGQATTAEMQCETAGFLADVARGAQTPRIPLGCAGP